MCHGCFSCHFLLGWSTAQSKRGWPKVTTAFTQGLLLNSGSTNTATVTPGQDVINANLTIYEFSYV